MSWRSDFSVFRQPSFFIATILVIALITGTLAVCGALANRAMF